MIITMNQPEIEQALQEFLQKNFAVPVTVSSFNLKGLRLSSEYSADIDLELDSVSYTGTTLPRLTAPQSKRNPESNTVHTEPEEPEVVLTPTDQKHYIKILELLETNPQDCNYNTIQQMLTEVNECVADKVKTYPAYLEMVQRVEEARNQEVEESSTEEEHDEEDAVVKVEATVETSEETSEPEAETTEAPVMKQLVNTKSNSEVNIFGKPVSPAGNTFTNVSTQATDATSVGSTPLFK